MNFFRFLLPKWRLVVMLFVVLPTFAGLIGFGIMPKELNPDIQLPLALVIVPYPGAGPLEVESLVTNKLEEKLQTLDDLDDMLSTSSDGASVITVRFQAGADVDEAIRDTKEIVSDVKGDLPGDILDPEVLELNFNDFPIVVISLTGLDDYVALTEAAEDLQTELEGIPNVLEAAIIGGSEREFQVDADLSRLQTYRLTLLDLIDAIAGSNAELPGGLVDMAGSNFQVRVDGKLRGVDDLRSVVVAGSAAGIVRLGDVAGIRDGIKEASTFSRLERKPTVSLAVKKRQGTNTIDVTRRIKEKLEEVRPSLPAGTEYKITGESSQFIERSLTRMRNSAQYGFVVVAAILFLFMGLRNAAVVATVIPLTIFTTLAFLWAARVTINDIVLFSLILVIGMIVDNAVVVVENIYRHLQERKRRAIAAIACGLSPDEATLDARGDELDAIPDEKLDPGAESALPMSKLRAWAAARGASEVALPILTSTLTTVFAFMPMLIMGGVVGEFMGYIPKTVSLALLASFGVAMLVNPVLSATWIKAPLAIKGTRMMRGDRWTRWLRDRFGTLMRWALRHRRLVLLSSIPYAIGAVALIALGVIKVEMFPPADVGQLYINVQAPSGTRVETTNAIVRRIEEVLEEERWKPYLEHYVANVGYSGTSTIDFSFGGGAENFAQIVIDLVDDDQRDLTAQEIQDSMRPFLQSIPGARIDFRPVDSGPPQDAPVVVRIIGEDLERLRSLSESVQERLRAVPGAVDIKDDLEEGSPEILVSLDRERAGLAGVIPIRAALTTRAAVNGAEASTIRQEDKDVDVTVRLAPQYRMDGGDLAQLQVPSLSGTLVPLGQVAEIGRRAGIAGINHIDRERVVRVTASNAPGNSAVEISRRLQSDLKDFPLPPGYRFDYRGDFEQFNESFQSLSLAFLIAILLIYVLMVAQFSSLTQPLVILATIPMGIFGALYGLAIGGQNFALIALIAVVGLAGVVVNSAIILVDYINSRRRAGFSRDEAVVEASLIRLRPVLLTAATTILGLMPLIVDQAEWRPLGFAFVFGLAFATVLTLVIIPMFYTVMDDLRTRVRRIFGLAPIDWRE